MRIGIIGSGHIGSALTRRLRKLGHDVAVSNSRGPDTLSTLASETGAQAVTVNEAARGRDMLIIAIPEKSYRDLAADLFINTPVNTIVVDTGNYYPARDGTIAAIEDGTPSSVWVTEQIGRPVIKAFNTIQAERLMNGGKPSATPDRRALPVSGDDDTAKGAVIRLIDALGFDGVDAGNLNESWRQEPGTPVYGADLNTDGVLRAIGEAQKQRDG
ncbi:MAG TPA: NAD(P)-binding domain-containing protein [Gemmatimonadaceae bacterium]